ncbi:SdrD B-like domain-containing protein [Thiothrix nivea]|nr:SdrD B-like domain-containing protein [Thiothrix nivea]
MPENRFYGNTLGFALQILFVWLLLTVVSGGSANAAAFTYQNTTSTSIPNGGCSSGYTNITIPVGDNFTVTDLNVGITISHARRQDLDVKLTSPSGTSIFLFTDVGGNADHIDILLDDSFSNDIASAIGTTTATNHNTSSPYYENQFNPEGSATLASFNGENAQGDWVLGVCDDYGSSTSGTFRRVWLDFTGNPVTGGISGQVYLDSNGSDSYDAGDSGLGNIRVTLYNENFTPSNTADDTFIAYADTSTTDGSYSFNGLDPNQTYRLVVDTTDTDLPAGAVIGTDNPLTLVVIPAGGTTANKNFGFDPVLTDKDYGDAPASYGDASHHIVAGIHLGNNAPDAETASQNTHNAMGDGDDEDGAPKQYGNPAITLFPILKMTALSYSIDIKTTNTTGSAGNLYGWIDFDQNGAFDLDEAASISVADNTDATVTLTWNTIPSDIELGTTFIRLRLTTDVTVTASTPANHASNGEVEDFPIAVAMDIPPDSPDVTIVRGEEQTCSSTIFSDNFDDLATEQYFGEHTSATPFVIRGGWTATGGGNDTYARTVEVSPFTATQGRSIYFGNGMIRRYYPDTGAALEFDGNGRMLNPPDAIELRTDPDDVTPGVNLGESDWGPEPVMLSRTFSSTPGQRYRLYFSAIPEGGTWSSGVMRVDTPSGSVHFKAPGQGEGIQRYRIEFTAVGTSSTIRFVNYGHIGTDGGWCDPNSSISGAWCTVGGFPIDKKGNELIIDDVAVAVASTCPTSNISGTVYADTDSSDTFNAGTDSGLANVTVMLYDNNGTATITNDDTQVTTTTTTTDGTYSFTDISPALHYRIEVDTRDADLPASAHIGTTNPLADVVVTPNSTLANQDFGFDLACNASAGEFGGIAFRDYNQNGIRERQEEGVAGVVVTAYDSTDTLAATATTDSRGWYTLVGLTAGAPYRLEYTNLPNGLHPGVVGTDAASTVRFVTASGNCAANLGVSDPVEYCQATPAVAAFNFVNGDPDIADVGNYASLFTFPYDATGNHDNQTPPPVTKANTSQTGALWGMAYQKTTKTLYASATMRRFSGLGPLGTGGIYKIDMTDPGAAYTGAAAYVDLRTIGIDTGDDVRNPADSCNNLANGPWLPSHDVAAWDMVGKRGVGDIDYDEPNNRLWLVNLNDRKLYGINNASPATSPTAADVLGGYAMNQSCTSGTFRPWAVKYHRGYVYVGGVCDAASDPYNPSLVRGHILRFDPANAASGFSHVKDFAINQPRSRYGTNSPDAWSGWLPQADAVNVRPQFHSPIVANLEFDTDGSIIVGIIDRAGLQKGTNSYDEPACDDPTLDYADTMGDVLRLCKTDTGYLTDSEPGCSTAIPKDSKSTQEYYWGDLGPSDNAWESMNEIAAGGLAFAPGKEHVLASAYDANSWGSNGVVWLNNRTGAKDNSYHISWATLGKSTGMGELEVLCDPAPTEIGNRVWLDSDSDGIQDADEAGIASVDVTLQCGIDSETATTDANGEYYFSNKPASGINPGGNAMFMDAGENCTLKIDSSQATLNSYTLTTQDADAKTDNSSFTDIRDSDAVDNSGTAEISFTVGSAGENNHGLDFGYSYSSYSNNYCVTPSGSTGLLELGDMPTSLVSGINSFTYADRVLPGYGTVDITVTQDSGAHYASDTAIDSGARQQSWLDENLPASGTAIYMGPGSGGTTTVTYDFDQPTGNVDLLLLDLDEDDTVTLTAKDSSGNTITDFSGWRYRTGDLSVWANPDPVAQAPAWNAATATLTSTDNANDHRSFGLLTPDVLVSQIVVSFTAPAASGRHVYTILNTTDDGRDGETSCPTGIITGTVYTDNNPNNDTLDAAESKLPNITVRLFDSTKTTELQTAVTDTNGAYSFTGVAPDTYQVEVDTTDPELPAGSTIGTTNPLANVNVTAGNTTADQNFGIDNGIPPACTTSSNEKMLLSKYNADQIVSFDWNNTTLQASGLSSTTAGLSQYHDVTYDSSGRVFILNNNDQVLEVDLSKSTANKIIANHGTITGANGSTAFVGDTEGYLYTQAFYASKLSIVKFKPETPSLVTQVVDVSSVSIHSPGNGGDLAWSDGYLYWTVQAPDTTTHLIKIDSGTGNILFNKIIKRTNGSSITGTNPLFNDGKGNLFILTFNDFYRVDNATAIATLITSNSLYGDNVPTGGASSLEFCASASKSGLSGKVWFDANSDGIQNDGAGSYIQGASVELYDPATSTVVASTITDTNGQYQFSSTDGLQVSTNYQLRISKLDNQSPVSGWAITTLHAGSDTTLDSDASLSGSYWTIALTSPATGVQTSGYGFGLTNTVATGCLNNGATGISNDSIANSHPNTYDFEFDGKHVVGFCSERTEGDPQAGDNYSVNASDRQGLTALQREKIARSYAALTDPDIVFGIASAFGSGNNQRRLDDLLHYMTWFYTYYAEDLDGMSAAHLDTNSNYTAEQRVAMKALAGKVADRVNGVNGETQYPVQDIFWLWNTTSSDRQDIVVPAIYAAGSSCNVVDRGDAPISGTAPNGNNTNAYGEATHTIVSSIQLGATIDADSVSQASTNADGDDTNGSDDEDSISTFPVLTQGNTSYSIPAANISVTNTTGGNATLYGFIDFNGDGDFADAGETATATVANGATNPSSALTFSGFAVVPSISSTIARFRLSTDSGLNSTTTASDGEVEDYALAIYSLPTKEPNPQVGGSGQCTGILPNSISHIEVGYVDTSYDWSRHVLTYTPPSGSDRVLVFVSSFEGIDGSTDAYLPISGVTYGGVPMTHLGDETVGMGTGIANGAQSYWYLKEADIPSGGPHAFMVTPDYNHNGIDAGSETDWMLAAYTFFNIDQTATPEFSSVADPNPGTTYTTPALGSSSFLFSSILSGKGLRTFTATSPDTTLLHSIAFGDSPGITVGAAARSCGESITYNIDDTPNRVITASLGFKSLPGCACGEHDSSDAPADGSTAPDGTAGATAYGEATHTIVNGIRLGATIDPDSTSLASANADGDDTDGTDDEDGISTFPDLAQGDTSYSIPAANISVSNTTGGAATLYGFIDFNGDGDFADAGESASVSVPSGATNPAAALSFTGFAAVPNTITGTFARFRLSTDTGLSSTAAASDGEVEDYALTISTAKNLSGKVFEDVNYGGGAGRDANASGAAGVGGATVELYDASGNFVSTTSTAADGSYSLANVPTGTYYVRVVNSTVNSTRSGSNGTELGVQTYRSNGLTAVTNEVGGRKPDATDAEVHDGIATLNTTTFTFSGGTLAGKQAQSVTPLTLSGSDISGVDFGFNFNTVVNTNDALQGSLRQFILNSNLLGGEATLAQTGRTAGKENAIFELPTSDPKFNAANQYWSIAVATAMPEIGDDVIIDASTQPARAGFAFANRPVIELDGTIVKNLDQWHNGLILSGTNGGSTVKYLAINRFQNAGVKIRSSKNNTVSFNFIGTDPLHSATNIGNLHGIEIISSADLNLISDNLIAHNGWDGIHAWNFNGGGTAKAAIISQNSIYANGGLGINLEAGDTNGSITTNDVNDADTGANSLLNFPIFSQVSLSGSNLILKGCAPTGATVELFEADVSPGGAAAVGDNKFSLSNDYGEGQTYLTSFVEGSAADADSSNCALATDADGNNQTGMKAFSITIPTPVGVVEGDILTATATLGGTGTSEFSPTVVYTTPCSLVVTTTADTDNATNSSGSLRDALECANSTPATDTITFNIPTSQPGYTNPDGIASNGDEYWSIKPTSALPGITQSVIIDGASQPGTTCPKPLIEINGGSAGVNVDGLGLYASNSTVKGLIINDFSRYGILLSRFPINFPTSNTLQTNNTVECSYIGVSASGLVAKPNMLGGIAAEGDSMKIGGTTADKRNIISGNGAFGIYFYGGGSTNGVVQGNYIGVGADGTTALGNSGFGIGYYNTDGVGLIGGTAGVTVNGACTGTCNIIAHNTSAGIGSFWTGPAGRNIRISGNSIHSNGGIGIDLEGGSSTPPWELDGVTPNDVGDTDPASAPNALQNYPVLASATLTGANTSVSGTLNSIANATFTLEFFANTTADPTGYGEGERYLGNTTVTTNASGNASFTVSLPTVASGTYITSTATDASNNTSEFSAAVTAAAAKNLSGKVFEDVNYGGTARSFDATQGMAGIDGATVELLDSSNTIVATTTTAGGGNYTFTGILAGSYTVRLDVNSVGSTRPHNGAGTELGVITYRSDSALATTAGATAAQAVTVAASDLTNVNFGFNFDTVSNTNDSGAGSLRQFILNANLLGGDAALQQAGLPAGKENAVLKLATTDPNYSGGVWTITLNSFLPDINQPLILDGSKQATFNSTTAVPVIELNGNGGAGNGLTLVAGSTGSQIRSLEITHFSGDGVNVQGSTNSNSILGNSIHGNGGLGIDLVGLVGGTEDAYGVTENDVGDTDNGPNSLLNYPEFKTLGITNGSKIITYDFDLDVVSGTYRMEFFKNGTADASGHGEGQIYLGGRNITVTTSGNQNYKGSFNANQVLNGTDKLAVTLTRMEGAEFRETSEFSGTVTGTTTTVCEEWVNDPSLPPADLVIDENSNIVAFIKAKDASGNTITYALKGNDGKYFTITTGSSTTADCQTIQMVNPNIVITKSARADAETRAIVPPGYLPAPGNYEVPMDSDKDNVYQFQITATYANGQQYTRDFSIQVMDVNEAPIITSAAAVTFNEDSSANVLDIISQDPDAGTAEGSGLTYSITGGVDASRFEVAPATGILRFRGIPDYDAPTDTNRDNLYEVEVTVTDDGGLSGKKTFKVTVVNNSTDDGVLLNVRTLLQGAYDSASGLMSDALNTQGLLPAQQPYKAAPFNHAGTETLSAMVREATGNNAIVDWALVDLRSSLGTIAATRAVMLQRDGDLVDPQTGSPDLHFANTPAGSYYVSVRHRNHLGIVSASPISLDHSARLLNLASSSTAVKGEDSRLVVGKVAMMWAGDLNASNTLTANGPGNDVTTLLGNVITDTENQQANTNFIMRGYLASDLNMDGKTLSSGPNNDASLLVGNIILHPLNTDFAANYIVRGGLYQ